MLAPRPTIDLDAYLRRISYEGPLQANFETLRGLHRAHLLAIPYENFDVQMRRPLTTDPHAAFAKIVDRGRGGWCYEMNGVFGLVLEAIGFDVTRLAADGSSEHSHLVLTVAIGGSTYVADVGFADGPIEPYPLIEGSFNQDGFEYRIENESAGRWHLHNHRFGMAPGFVAGGPNEPAMADRCRWLQSSPDSPFVKHPIACGHTPNGIVTLVGLILRIITPNEMKRIDIATPDEYVATLKTHFGLELPETAELWPAVHARHQAYLRESAARKAALNISL